MKKRKYIGPCDNPSTLILDLDSRFDSLPINLKKDFSKNGAFHIREQKYINMNINQYPNLCYAPNEAFYLKKI